MNSGALAVRQRSIHPVHLFALGCAAIVAQSVFVRELLALFTGAELVIGIVLAGWLLWVGVGAMTGGRAAPSAAREGGVPGPGFSAFSRPALAAAALLPVTVLLIRAGRAAIVRPPGALAPLVPALVFAVLALAPFGVLYGRAYNGACLLWGARGGSVQEGIGRVYALEAGGSVFGAILFSFALVSIFTQLEAALVAGLLLVLVVTLAPPRAEGRRRRTLLFFAIVVVSGVLAPTLDRASIRLVYPGYAIEEHYSSRYGEVTIARREEMRSFFSGGGRLYSIPEPERTQSAVHIPLLAHPAPRAVLLVGGSLGGGWEEAAKHPSVESIDCVELDGSLFAREPAPAAGARPAVRFIAGDGRFELAKGKRRYDVIVVSTPAPVNLQWNRYYTEEFFRSARRALAPGGVFAISHPSSENFLSADQKRALACVGATLRSAFDEVAVAPGTTAQFLGGVARVEADTLLRRLAERGIDAPFVGPGYLPNRLDPERVASLARDIAGAGAAPRNRDARPVLTLYELALESARTGGPLAGAARGLLAVPPFAPAIALGAVLLVLFAAARGGLRARLAVWSVGAGGFLAQLLSLLGFQSFSGNLYHAIVLLTASFMAGAAGGSILALRRRGAGAGTMRLVHGGFVVLAALFAGWFSIGASAPFAAGAAAFFALSAAGGFLTGSYYPAAVRVAFPEGGGAAPATFYAWDLFGAAVAGALGGAVLYPLAGAYGTALSLAALNAMALALLARRL